MTIELPGGDMTSHVGIGYVVEKYYPQKRVSDPSGGSQFYFNFILVLFFVALFTGIQYLISIFINNAKKKKQSTPS
jgi:hypothetical protein